MNKIYIVLFVLVSCSGKTQSPYPNHDHWIVGGGDVLALAQDASHVYAGGTFTYVGPPTGYGGKITTSNTKPDLTFCRPNGSVNVTIPDGTGGWYIGGSFTQIVTSFSTMVNRSKLAHILSNGQLDMTWNPYSDGNVYSIVSSGSDLFIGGDFHNIGGQIRHYLAKISAIGTGTADAIWNPDPFGGPVWTIVLSGSDLFVGGEFGYIANTIRNRIAKISAIGSGSLDLTWNPGSSGYIYSMSLLGNDLYVGGSFLNIGGAPRNGIAKLTTLGTGMADVTWNPNSNGTVRKLILSGSNLFVGGEFTNIGGQPRNRIAKLNTLGVGTADVLWNPNVNGFSSINTVVNALELSGTDLYIAGEFTNVGGQPRSNIAKVSANGIGAVDLMWNPNSMAKVNSIALSGNDVYIGGDFFSFGGYNRNRIARFSKITGEADSNWDPDANSSVFTILISGTNLFVGGSFTSIGGLLRNKISKLSTIGSGISDPIWDPTSYGDVNTLAISGNDLYAGGAFTYIGGGFINRIAKISAIGTGTVDFTWNPNSNGNVNAIVIAGNDLYVGGAFTNIGGQLRNRIVKLNTIGSGTADPSWNPNANNVVKTLALSGSDLYVGGNFTNIGGEFRNRIAKLSLVGTGTVDLAWNPSAGNVVNDLDISGSDLYVGGDFTFIGSQNRNRIGKLTTTGFGNADFLWDPNSNSSVNSLLISGNDLYIGGSFSTLAGGFPKSGLALLGNLCIGPTIPTLNISNAMICSNESTTLSITGGTLNTATSWQWYNSSCGAGSVGTGTSIIVNPTTTTTYYARGEGGCVANTATCSNITVVVNPTPTVSVLSTGSVCIGTSANLIANGASTYTWSTGAITSSVNISPTTTTTYSVTGANAFGCSNTQTTNLVVDNTCQDVWPGDANSDGIANNLDVLELGLHYTNTGPARAIISNTWQAYFSNNWSGIISNGKNLNHSDCNGDGSINANDTLAINLNYGLTHAFKNQQNTTFNNQLNLVPDQAMVAKGTWGTASLFLGDNSNPINNINGLAFTVDYDHTLLEADSLWLEYVNSFIDAGQNLRFRKLAFTNGKLYAATTHTNNVNSNGNGLVAKLHYKINPNLTNDVPLNLSISQSFQSDAAGVISSLTSGGTSTLIAIGASVGIKEFGKDIFYVSPNPTNGILYLSLQTSTPLSLTTIEILNSIGQVLESEKIKEQNVSSDSYRINISNYPAGIYFVKATIAGQSRVVKVVKE